MTEGMPWLQARRHTCGGVSSSHSQAWMPLVRRRYCILTSAALLHLSWLGHCQHTSSLSLYSPSLASSLTYIILLHTHMPPLLLLWTGSQVLTCMHRGLHSLATRLYCILLFIHQCMPVPILYRNFWPTVGHLVHTIAAQGGCNGSKQNYPPSILQCYLSTKDDI